jgi:hypothetical protein
MSWHFARGFVLFADDSVSRRYKVTITGRGPFGDMPKVEYVLDLDDLRGIAAPRDGSLHQIAESVDGLGKAIDQAATFLGRGGEGGRGLAAPDV